jgi:hypothetical protein
VCSVRLKSLKKSSGSPGRAICDSSFRKSNSGPMEKRSSGGRADSQSS